MNIHSLALFLALAPALHGQTLGEIETFTDQETAQSWGFYDYSDGTEWAAPWDLFGSDNPEIFAIFTEDYGVLLFADELSSGGRFVGDYSAAGIDKVSCDIFIEDHASFGWVEFYFFAGGDYYCSEIPIIDASGWWEFGSSFSKNTWYVYEEDDDECIEVELTPQILSEVDEIGLNFIPGSIAADGMAVGVDNFALLPNLAPPTVSISTTPDSAEFSFTGIEGMQYTIQSSPSLDDDSWTNVGSPFEIIGPSQTTLPIANKSFFRLLATPVEIPAP